MGKIRVFPIDLSKFLTIAEQTDNEFAPAPKPLSTWKPRQGWLCAGMAKAELFRLPLI
jgi:hypothetical protein